jgi:hypothetical protein
MTFDIELLYKSEVTGSFTKEILKGCSGCDFADIVSSLKYSYSRDPNIYLRRIVNSEIKVIDVPLRKTIEENDSYVLHRLVAVRAIKEKEVDI